MTEVQADLCPACLAQSATRYLSLPALPTCANFLWPSASQATAVPKRSIALAMCGDCGLIFNPDFQEEEVEYSPAYDNTLHCSEIFKTYASDLADELIHRYKLFGKNIIEFGCGQAHFLQLLCEKGANYCTGYDPAYDAEAGCKSSGSGSLTMHARLFEPADAKQPINLLCFRHVLEHIRTPHTLLHTLRQALQGQTQCVLYCEVPNMLDTLRRTNLWDVIYEHCTYYSAHSLAQLFERTGFEVLNLTERFGGQYVSIEARPGKPVANPIPSAVTMTKTMLLEFAQAYEQKVNSWRTQLQASAKTGKRTVIWGAGSKGVSFLNAVAPQSAHLRYAIDVNPRKHGRFIAGAGQQIAAPEFLLQHQPDIVLLMNGNYQQEVTQILSQMHIQPQLLVV